MKRLTVLCVISLLCLGFSGCGSTKGQKGLTGGVGLGALIGGLAGGGSGTAIGAAASGGLGYVVGNEEDKEDANEQAAQERAALQKAHISKDPQTAYRPPNENPLAGSTWRVIIISLVSDDQVPDYHSMVVTFQTNTKLTTLTVLGNNKTEISVESYRVVDDVLVITGKGYVINATYSVEGKRMIVVAPQLKVVLEEVEEKI